MAVLKKLVLLWQAWEACDAMVLAAVEVSAKRPRNVGKHPSHVLRTSGSRWTNGCQHAKVRGGRGRDPNKGLAHLCAFPARGLERILKEVPTHILRAYGGYVEGAWRVGLRDAVGERTRAITCDGGHMSYSACLCSAKTRQGVRVSAGRVGDGGPEPLQEERGGPRATGSPAGS